MAISFMYFSISRY